MRKSVLALFLLTALTYSCNNSPNPEKLNLSQYVNPFIGTQGKGNLYPGATVPFGMVQVSPDQTENGELCAAYQYNFNYIHGFSHTHLTGTGIGDLTDLLLMPTTGAIHLSYNPDNIPGKGYQSRITKTTENATPGYYTVMLDDYNIQVELTATERCGMQKYTFPQSESAHVIFDLKYLNTQRHEPCILESEINIVNDSLVTGSRLVHNWAPHRYFFFAAKFSKPFKNKGIAINDTLIENTATAKGTNLKAHFDFKTEENEVIMVKVAVSSVSTEGAIKNLDAEIADWDFDAVKSNARKAWNAELAKTYAQFNDTAVRKTFYTSLYRTMLSPVTHADVDSSYRGSDNNIHKGNHKNYHIYSLWDTFRALHPWLTITQPQRVNDMIQSMLAIFNESGHLPVWHFGNGENNCMIGFHAMPVITDAYLKGLTNIDGNKILNAMIYDIHGNGSIAGTDSFKQDAGGVFTKNAAIYGTKLFHQYGFIPGDIANAAVSRTLEYTYNNYNVYQMAKAMNNDTARYFQKCAGYYKNVFDSQCGFMRGKNAQGLFYNTGFKPEKQDWGWWVGPEHSEYVEGSGWQWLWFVPHDISGLIELLGGREATAKKLDTYFDRSTKGEETDEASGYIGQHAQGNEPGHHTPYLYNYVGQPWKSQKIVRDLMAETYSNKPDGLSGNDDCGQMSAWYVFSALGFYPVNASGGLYVFGSPAVKSASINVGNGKTFKIETKNYAPQNIYIQKVWLNGNEYNKTWISHADIVSGSKLVFEMGKEPNINWGINPEACPPISVY